MSLTIWLSICPLTWVNANQPLVESEKNADYVRKGTVPFSPTMQAWRPENRDSPQVVIDASLSVLEKRLFADAKDGQLHDFSLLNAALIASGVDNSAELGRYRERMAAWAEQLRQNGRFNGSPRQRIEVIFEFLHGGILRGKYNIECTDLRQALDEGHFNCVSATVLFNCLAGELGFSCCALETPGHALSRVFLCDGPLDVETTCPRWFHLKHDPAKQAEALEKTIGRKPTYEYSAIREISPIQLTAMIYYNRGVDFLAEKRFAEAAAANAKAVRLDPHNVTVRGNLLATINNWAIELSNAGRFAEAVDLLRQGLLFDPHYEAFVLNFVHVHYQWSQHLCKEGRYTQAAELLDKAALEMPDRELLRRAVWEVYRRWSLNLFEADKIDEAFGVFTEARRRHGECREEMECELAVVIEYGKKLLTQNRYEEARRIFDRALILQPDSAVLRER